MDMIVLEDFSLSDLNDDTIQSYRNYHSTVKPGHVWGKLQKEDYLEKIGAAGRIKAGDELHPTAAGLLMFGEEYRIVRRFPDYFLDYREELGSTIRWTNRIQSSSGDWSGNLFDFFFRVYNKLTIDIEKPFALDGVTRVEDTPVHKAVREALVNCIVNTDFYLPEGIVILKKQNKIVFQNPGSIRTGKTQMLRGGISDPRNISIMKMLNLISIGERAGSGVPDIYSVWANKGWEEPVVEEQYAPDRTILILSFVSNENFVTYISDADYVNNKADCGSDSGVGDADYRTNDADYGADRGVGDADYRTDDADYGADRGVGDADYRTDDADYGANRGVGDADYGTDDADYGADRGVGDADYEAYEADNNTNHESNDANHSLDKGTIEVIILSSLRENPRITQKEIAAKIGVSRATIQRIMKSMIDEGIVVRIGTKSGYWQIRE